MGYYASYDWPFLASTPREAHGWQQGLNFASRFWGVSWKADRSKWLVRYKDTSTPAKNCHVGYFTDEEAAALAYNKAIIEADLEHLRVMNRVDASGRPLPKDQD